MAYSEMFDNVKNALKREGLTFNITKRELLYGNRDGVTGWFSKTFNESTIEMIIIEQSNQQFALKIGTYVKLDALGFSKETLKEADQVKYGDVFYEVKSIRTRKVGDKLAFYEYDLTKLPLGVT